MRQRLQSGATWQTVECLSDLHLSPETPNTTAAFFHYLQNTTADAVLILGDLVEAWVGDDIQDDPWALQLAAQLSLAAERFSLLGLMVGNRDFLMGEPWLDSLGVVKLDDPCTLVVWGRNLVLSHGDALCLDDQPYQAFRRQVRSPLWQAQFLAESRARRVALAEDMRQASATHQRSAPLAVTMADADPGLSLAWLGQADSQVLIHGHTHRPALHQPAVAGAGFHTQRWVLSDWDLDQAHGDRARADVLRIDAEGVARHNWVSRLPHFV